MKKVLGIIGSPRKTGNCEIMVKEISRNIQEPHVLNLIRLPKQNILPCRACYSCIFDKEQCEIDDDFHRVLDALVDADALIVATPTYFFGPNASLKKFLDRGLSFYAKLESLWSKPAVGVCIAGMDGNEGYTKLALESFLHLVFCQVKATEIVYGALPGEIFLHDKAKEIASKLGKAIFSEPVEMSAPSCPQCGGDTFRFLSDGYVRCMLCSNEGAMYFESGSVNFEIKGNKHHLFLSRKSVLLHLQRLRELKEDFLDKKDKLREITRQYKDEGTWL